MENKVFIQFIVYNYETLAGVPVVCIVNTFSITHGNINLILFQDDINDVVRVSPASSNEEDNNTKINMHMKPLILTQIIKASPEEDTSGPISPPPLKPNMAHKAW